MTVEPKIPGAVIPRRVFTQPGSISDVDRNKWQVCLDQSGLESDITVRQLGAKSRHQRQSDLVLEGMFSWCSRTQTSFARLKPTKVLIFDVSDDIGLFYCDPRCGPPRASRCARGRKTPTPFLFCSRGRAMGPTSSEVWRRGIWGASGHNILESRL